LHGDGDQDHSKMIVEKAEAVKIFAASPVIGAVSPNAVIGILYMSNGFA